jgi:hypothetical protein
MAFGRFKPAVIGGHPRPVLERKGVSMLIEPAYQMLDAHG